ncbi:MAG TPA: hypothetical protein PKG63_00090 [Bacteroidales bacterium]|jgi:hypothetical protein|nr:hypothetical protein [Bacteroidales bacterium]HNV94842.1 hypothetical protein [Bacteroidales bacterium]HOU97565.1 hypothetical protein [Bacteroidales bacterium]
MKTIVIFAILFCSIISLKGQKNPEEVVDSFFTYFNSKGVERSLQYVFATNKYLKQNPEIVTNLKAKFDKALPVLGTFYRYEKYMHKQVGSTFAHIGYLMVFDRQPIKIIFTLYYASDHWQIQDLRFDDKIDDVIKELPNLVK